MPVVLSGSLVELRLISEDDIDALIEASSESRESYRFADVPSGVERMRAGNLPVGRTGIYDA
jgi:hypothetical protein